MPEPVRVREQIWEAKISKTGRGSKYAGPSPQKASKSMF